MYTHTKRVCRGLSFSSELSANYFKKIKDTHTNTLSLLFLLFDPPTGLMLWRFFLHRESVENVPYVTQFPKTEADYEINTFTSSFFALHSIPPLLSHIYHKWLSFLSQECTEEVVRPLKDSMSLTRNSFTFVMSNVMELVSYDSPAPCRIV